MSAQAAPELVRMQEARFPQAEARAQAKLAAMAPDRSANALLKAAQKAKSVRQRVVWLQRAASAWAAPMEAVAACRAGCSHCCQIPVTISQVEAQIIAAHTGRTLRAPARSLRVKDGDSVEALAAAEAQLHVGPLSPCPLLKDGRCSAYEHRPLACRTLVNLDDDELLCRHAPGHSSQVPYANATQLKAIAIMAQPGVLFADIREFLSSE